MTWHDVLQIVVGDLTWQNILGGIALGLMGILSLYLRRQRRRRGPGRYNENNTWIRVEYYTRANHKAGRRVRAGK